MRSLLCIGLLLPLLSSAVACGGEPAVALLDDSENEAPPVSPATPSTEGNASGGAATSGDDEPAAPSTPTVVSAQPGTIIEAAAFRGLLSLEGAQAAEQELGDHGWEDLVDSDATHALIITAAAWCPPCQGTASALGSTRLADVERAREAGGVVIELLLQGRSIAPATDADVMNWATAYSLPFSVFAPGDADTMDLFPTRECGYIIDLQTSEVLSRAGCYPVTPISALDDFLEILGVAAE